MDKRGDTSIMMDTILHIIIFILFFSVMFWFVGSYSNGAAFWEDFYAKEIVRVINGAEPGMEFKIDVTKLAVVAFKKTKPIKDIVYIDNVNNRVVVSSRLNAGTSFGFFKDVDIVEWKTEGPSGRPENTQFMFKVKERGRNDLS